MLRQALNRLRKKRRKNAVRQREHLHRRFEILEDRRMLTGELDPSFGGDGRVLTDTGLIDLPDNGRDIAVQSDGKVVVVGESMQDLTGLDFAVIRYNDDGTRDTSFGVGGIVTIDFGSNTESGWGVAIDSLGRILVSGSSYQVASGSNDFAVARLNPSDGSLDLTFNLNGKQIVDFGGTIDRAYAVAVDSHDNVLVAGSMTDVSVDGSVAYDFAVARFNANDGSLDMTFNSSGKQVVDFGGADDYGYDVVVDSEDNIIVAGRSEQTGPTAYDFAVARLNASNGQLDTTFNSSGKQTVDFGNTYDFGRSVAVDSNNNVFVVGASFQSSGYDFAIAKLNANDGALDMTFNSSGKQIVDFADATDKAYAVAIDSYDNVLVAGNSYFNTATRYDFAIARLNGSDGQLDTDFNSSGKQTIDLGTATLDFGYGVAVDANNNVLVTGNSYEHGSRDNHFATARLIGYSNSAPVIAGAGGPYFVTEDATLPLDGSNVTDADQDPQALTYTWDLDGDGIFGEIGETGISPTFSALNLTPGDIVSISLRVTDDEGAFDQASTTVTIEAAEPADLANVVENLITSGETQVELAVTSENTDEFLESIAELPPNTTGGEVEITLKLSGTLEETIAGQEISVPAGYTLIIDGNDAQTTFAGASPALTVLSGNVIFKNGILFTNTTAAPTILVTGGSLALRNTTINETTGGDFAAIVVTGGTLDLGQTGDPGGNTINVRGAGQAIRNESADQIWALGNVFQDDGLALDSPFDIEDLIYHAFDSTSVGEVSYLSGNVAPRVDVGIDRIVDEGDAVSITGQFIDLNLSDTHTFLWNVSNDADQVIFSGTDKDFSFTPLDDGVYNVVYRVTDNGSAYGEDSLVVTVNNTGPPAIVDVLISGSTWSKSNASLLAPFSLITGTNPEAPLPWINLNTIEVVFDQNVNVALASLSLVGINSSNYTSPDPGTEVLFDYNDQTFTATWQFPVAFGIDRLSLGLSGDISSGAAIASVGTGLLLNDGSGYSQAINVLPGDVNRSELTTITDLINVATRVQLGTFNASYDRFHDLNGDGAISSTDMVNTAANLFNVLPTASPAAPAAIVDAVDSVDSIADLRIGRAQHRAAMAVTGRRSLARATVRQPSLQQQSARDLDRIDSSGEQSLSARRVDSAFHQTSTSRQRRPEPQNLENVFDDIFGQDE